MFLQQDRGRYRKDKAGVKNENRSNAAHESPAQTFACATRESDNCDRYPRDEEGICATPRADKNAGCEKHECGHAFLLWVATEAPRGSSAISPRFPLDSNNQKSCSSRRPRQHSFRELHQTNVNPALNSDNFPAMIKENNGLSYLYDQ